MGKDLKVQLFGRRAFCSNTLGNCKDPEVGAGLVFSGTIKKAHVTGAEITKPGLQAVLSGGQ